MRALIVLFLWGLLLTSCSTGSQRGKNKKLAAPEGMSGLVGLRVVGVEGTPQQHYQVEKGLLAYLPKLNPCLRRYFGQERSLHVQFKMSRMKNRALKFQAGPAFAQAGVRCLVVGVGKWKPKGLTEPFQVKVELKTPFSPKEFKLSYRIDWEKSKKGKVFQ